MDYEKALEKARSAYGTGAYDDATLEFLFPQLKESEDEKVRKEIISIVKAYRENCIDEGTHRFDDCLSWLEKQKEQKPLPGFENADEGIPGKDFIPVEWVDACNRYGKWKLVRCDEQKPAECISHLNVQGKGVYKICPRCKERMVRDDSKVYTSMPPQYGYECPKCGEMVFDTVMYDNPEMEEQKPAEWNKNDTVFLNEITDYFENKTVRLQHDLDMYAHWLKSLPERFNLQPKQEWSEEDKKMIDTIVSVLGQYIDYKAVSGTGSGYATPRYSKEIDWLKSLRPQPKQEWSEEDEKMLKCCLIAINHYEKTCNIGDHLPTKFNIDGYLASVDKVKSWLKSLRPSWRPSEEDIKMLEHIIGQYETGNKNSKVMGYLPRVEELSFLKNVLSKWKN